MQASAAAFDVKEYLIEKKKKDQVVFLQFFYSLHSSYALIIIWIME